MNELPVPVEFDPKIGQWTSGGHPMILIPRRFFVFIQMESERRFGIEQTAALYDAATKRAAKVWCQETMDRLHLQGAKILPVYLDRMSQRGMGQFMLGSLDERMGAARVDLRHSIMAREYGPHAGRCVCYSFASALAGAMEVILERAGTPYATVHAHEDLCESNGAGHCSFTVRTDFAADVRSGAGEPV